MENKAYFSLNEDYQTRIASIMEKKTEAEKKLADLRSDCSRDEILKAQMALIDHKVLEKMAQAQLGAAATLNEEKTKISVELDKHVQDREERIAAINAELENYEAEIKKTAVAVFRKLYPEIRQHVHAEIEAVLDLIDKVTEDLQKFNRTTNNETKMELRDLEDLIPRYSVGGHTKELSERLRKYFG